MTPWIQPAYRLMANLRFSSKFTLIATLFLIPLVFVTSQFWRDSSHSISQLEAELSGLQVLQQLNEKALGIIASANPDQSAVSSLMQLKEEHLEAARKYELKLDANPVTNYEFLTLSDWLPLMLQRVHAIQANSLQVIENGFSPDSYIQLTSLLELSSKHNQWLEMNNVASAEELGSSVKSMTSALNEYIDTIQRTIVSPDQVQQSSNQQVSVYRALGAELKGFQKVISTSLDKRLMARHSSLNTDQNLVLGITFVALCGALYLFAGFYQQINLLVSSFTKASSSLASGDLSVKMDECSHDEMLTVIRGINQVADSFRDLVTEAHEATNSVVHNSHSLDGQVKQTVAESEQQKSVSEKVSQAMQGVSNSAERVASHTTEAADSVRHVNGLAGETQVVIKEVVTVIQALMAEVQTASDTISGLAQEAENIGQVSDVIREIADQTNLLALNAAIEAARAGEQGRGFAVVADEVRTLAQRTQDSTEVIRTTIETLNASSQQAVDVIESSMDKVQHSVQKVEQGEESLQGITDAMGQIQTLNDQMADAAQQQQSVTIELQGAVQEITETAEKAASGAHLTAGRSQELSEVAASLEKKLGHFKI